VAPAVPPVPGARAGLQGGRRSLGVPGNSWKSDATFPAYVWVRMLCWFYWFCPGPLEPLCGSGAGSPGAGGAPATGGAVGALWKQTESWAGLDGVQGPGPVCLHGGARQSCAGTGGSAGTACVRVLLCGGSAPAGLGRGTAAPLCPGFCPWLTREAVLPSLPHRSSLVRLFYCVRKAASGCWAGRTATAGFIPAAAHRWPTKSARPLARRSFPDCCFPWDLPSRSPPKQFLVRHWGYLFLKAK